MHQAVNDYQRHELEYLVTKFGGWELSREELQNRQDLPNTLLEVVRRLYASFDINLARIEKVDVEDRMRGQSIVGGLSVLFRDYAFECSQGELNEA
jgi:hypothetical protein